MTKPLMCEMCLEPGGRGDRVVNRFGFLAHKRCQPWRYQVNDGVIYGPRGRVNGHQHPSGYVFVVCDGRSVAYHRLLWELVNGPIPAGMEINHIDGDKSNNDLSNLECVTPGDNQRHAYRTGLRRSMRGRHRVVTNDQIEAIRQRKQAGERVVDLASEYGISESHVYNLLEAA